MRGLGSVEAPASEKDFYMVRLGPQVTEWPYCLCVGHPVVDAQTWETYEVEAVQHSVLGVVVTDVVMALQEEDL